MKLILLLISGLLGLVLAGQWLLMEPEPPEIHRIPPPANTNGAQSVGSAGEPEFDLPPIGDFDNMDQRPLFVEGRRPIENEVEEEPTPVAPPLPKVATPAPTLDLRGIILIGNERIALLGRPLVKDGSVRLRTGQVVNDWTVTSIEADQVVMENAGEKSVTQLRKFKAVPLPAIPAPGKPAPTTPSGVPKPPVKPK